MSKIADMMNAFAGKWGPLSGSPRATFLDELAAIATESGAMERQRIQRQIEALRSEVMGKPEEKPEEVSEFEKILKEMGADRTHVDEGDGPVCSICSGLVKPNGQVCHDPSCLTLRARKLFTDLGGVL